MHIYHRVGTSVPARFFIVAQMRKHLSEPLEEFLRAVGRISPSRWKVKDKLQVVIPISCGFGHDTKILLTLIHTGSDQGFPGSA